MNTKKKHFSDWLFYILIVIAVCAAFGAVRFNRNNIYLAETITIKDDSLSSLKVLYREEKLQSIENHDNLEWQLLQMTIIYRKNDSLCYFEKSMNVILKPGMKFEFEGEYAWPNNSCLVYSFGLSNKSTDRLWAGAAQDIVNGKLTIKQ